MSLDILIACEFSGVVREAFRAKGHNVWSCDLLPTEIRGPHIRANILQVLDRKWDMMIAFPPCTYLTISGARWWKERIRQQNDALIFVRVLLAADIPYIALENPVGRISTAIRKPDQIIQPWQFGHPEVKKTCLWLKGLPLLKPTNIVLGREPRVHWAAPGPDRWKERSRTLPGIAAAMAEQWS